MLNNNEEREQNAEYEELASEHSTNKPKIKMTGVDSLQTLMEQDEDTVKGNIRSNLEAIKSKRKQLRTPVVEDIDDDDEDDYYEEEEEPGNDISIPTRRAKSSDNTSSSLDLSKYFKIALPIIVILIVVLIAGKFILQSNRDKTENTDTTDEIVFEDEDITFEDVDFEEAPVVEEEHLSDTDRDTLRAWGYTANEIEQFEIDKVNVEEKVKEAEKNLIEKRLQINKALLRESTASTDEQYKYVLSNSIFGLPIPVVNKNDTNKEYYSSTAVADYFKIPLQGYQCFVKLKIPNTEVVLYAPVSYNIYSQLEDSGNVQISYDYIKEDGVEVYNNIQLQP